ncbi:MAG: NAD-dependent epimerase/dehydratase family protein [Pseudomonadota bacterium]
MSGDSILLLGGAGFIGTALARRLAAQGKRVHVISRRNPTCIEPGIVVHAGDLGDVSLLEKLLPECGTVVHLASTTTPGSSAAHPARELGNLVPTLQLLEILQRWPHTHLIFLSSGGTVYGNPAHNPVSELAPLAPLSFHGANKVALEGFLQAFRASGHAVTVLRPSNAYGPGQSLHQGFGLVRTVLQNILRGSPLEIWGDGENVRDFVYVDDMVEAILLAAARPEDSGTYNVGSGKGYTINQVLAIAQQVSGVPVPVEYHPARSVDVREIVLDIAHIRAVTGWQPAIGLEEGIARTWHWLAQA